MQRDLTLALAIVLGVLAAGCFLLAGFLIGYGFRQLKGLLIEYRDEARLRRLIDEDTSSQVIDDSPVAIAQRKDAKMRKGEDDEDEDSQIVTTKSRKQKQADRTAEREKQLDKWMPDVKHRD